MVRKDYEWKDGAEIEEHTRRKHKILGEYLHDYLIVRCRTPQQERFRLAIVDGFAGGGRYGDGSPGSPLIFIEELRRAAEAINTRRAAERLGLLQIECLLVFNDASRDAIELLEANLAPRLIEVRQTCRQLHITVEPHNGPFEAMFPTIKESLLKGHFKNVLFNLDQCGHSHVERETILDIMRSFQGAEIFYTFVIDALLAFLRKTQPKRLRQQLDFLGLTHQDMDHLAGPMTNKEWLGTAERIVFEAFRVCAPYVSPFSINNPGGWHYWLIHFANNYRARQVYNNVLHANASTQIHYGRAGLDMLSYDPSKTDAQLYMFDMGARSLAREQLVDDIPRRLSESGDAMTILDLYQGIYNATPAHSDDIRTAIIANPDLTVVTRGGGQRRKANTIAIDDVIRLKPQSSMFPMIRALEREKDGKK